MQNRQLGKAQSISAAKSGISERSGRRLEKSALILTPKPRHWRTRIDPLQAIWESELLPLLQQQPALSGLTLWEHLDDHYPGQYAPSLLRSLQRRVKFFNVTQGQDAPIGQQGLSDFTHPDTPVTIAGRAFPHLIYQFRLAYSGWRYAQITQGGESYSALAQGLQNALHLMGGSPLTHRTDSLSAAYINDSQKQHLTQRYAAFCAHYGLKATHNNKGISHENGAIETAHRSLKHRIQQAIKLRGSSDFAGIEQYQALINQCIKRLNDYTTTKFTQEQLTLQPLPSTRFMDYSAFTVKVTTSSTIEVKRVTYSVPSRLVGQTINVHLTHDWLTGYIAQTCVLDLPRVYPDKKGQRARSIDYRHVINALAAKPQAFRYSVYRDELFPDDNYKQLWQQVDASMESQQACKWMVSVLKIAASQADARRLGQTLLAQSIAHKLPDLKQLQAQFLPAQASPDVSVNQHDLQAYDQFITGLSVAPEMTQVTTQATEAV